MSLTLALIFLLVLFCLEVIYFKIADHYNIIDQPNHRSSHTSVTIRGGGIIFPLAAIFFFLAFKFQYPYFIGGLCAIALISFLDDVLTLNNKLRLAFHLLAVGLLFCEWNLFILPWYWLLIAIVFVIATINAYNFMDGINGITGSYSLLAVVTLYYINVNVVSFTSSAFLVIVGLSLLVFNFFNFRKRAGCFAGDVGSVSIAFILIFVIGQLILKTHNLAYILLLLIYGMDTAFTVFFRKIRKENIYEAHRSHFYQYLANQLKYPHLVVSIIYFIAQFLINVILLFIFQDNIWCLLVFFLISILLFLAIRFLVEGKKHLLNPDV